jgi:hypothetical protein
MERVVINESTEDENISLEKQEAMQAEARQQSGGAEERPQWLDDKFKSPEELAKAYNELQSKLGENTPTNESETTEPTEENPSEAETDNEPSPQMDKAISKANSEYDERGELSDKTFIALEKAGLPRDMVETYIRGQEAIALGQAAEVQDTVGGNANYSAMTEWAGENLSDGDVDAFNAIVEGASVDQAKMAVKGLYAQFLAAGGKPPQLMQGGTSGTGVKPYSSTAQITEAMKDARYKNDPAFRASVEQRLAVSDVF